jgi:hypothetical protein
MRFFLITARHANQDRPLLLSLRQMYVTIFYLGLSVMTENSAVVFVNETLVFF